MTELADDHHIRDAARAVRARAEHLDPPTAADARRHTRRRRASRLGAMALAVVAIGAIGASAMTGRDGSPPEQVTADATRVEGTFSAWADLDDAAGGCDGATIARFEVQLPNGEISAMALTACPFADDPESRYVVNGLPPGIAYEARVADSPPGSVYFSFFPVDISLPIGPADSSGSTEVLLGFGLEWCVVTEADAAAAGAEPSGISVECGTGPVPDE